MLVLRLCLDRGCQLVNAIYSPLYICNRLGLSLSYMLIIIMVRAQGPHHLSKAMAGTWQRPEISMLLQQQLVLYTSATDPPLTFLLAYRNYFKHTEFKPNMDMSPRIDTVQTTGLCCQAQILTFLLKSLSYNEFKIKYAIPQSSKSSHFFVEFCI